MTWFGWLTKGSMNVSLLDWLIAIGEVAVIAATLNILVEWRFRVLRKRNRRP